MNRDIEKKLKKGKVLKCIMITNIVITVLFVTLGVILDIDPLLACGLIFFAIAIPTAMTYIEFFHPLCKSVKYLYKLGLQEVLNEIKTTEFNLPRSKIYMGQRAFFAKSPATIIPYTMVVWVYIQTTTYFGSITTDENVIICCRDGESFKIRADRNELPTLLQAVNKFSPDLIVGYGIDQIKQYDLIIKSKTKIINMKETITETGDERSMICKNCGNEFEKEFGLCPNCGTPIEKETQPTEKVSETASMAEEKHCAVCGAASKPEAKFCAKCGSQHFDNSYSPAFGANAVFGTPLNPVYAGGMPQGTGIPAKKKLKWWQILMISIAGFLAFSFVLGIIATIVNKDTSQFYGSWTAAYDYFDILNDELKSYDEEVASYINVNDFTVNFIFEFNEDNTYKLKVDEKSVDEGYNKLCEEYKRGFKEYINSVLAERNINVSADEFISLTGIDLDKEIEDAFDKEELEKNFKDMEAEGNFKADDGKLFLSDGKNYSVDEKVYEKYFFENDSKFTLTGSSELKTIDLDGDSVYPMTFEKK